MILNVRKHTGKMSLHGFFVICLCHMAKIRIVQKRQIWIFFSVPAYAHSGWQRTETNIWFYTITILIFCMNRTPEGSPFQFFLVGKILKPLNKIFVVHDIIDGNIREVPVIVIVICDYFFGILNTCFLTCLCIHFSFFSIFVYFPRRPCILVSRKVELHDRATQYIIIIKSEFSPHQAATDRSKFSRPAGGLWNDDIVFTVAP